MNKIIPLLFIVVFGSLFSAEAFAQVTIPRFAQVSPGIYRGSRPSSYSAVLQLKQLGIKTIINLDDDAPFIQKEKANANQAGIIMISSPMSGTEAPNHIQVSYILNVITNPNNQPVYVHCQYGRDRTGLIIGLYRVQFEGMNPQAAYQEMLSMGFAERLVNLKKFFWMHAGRPQKRKASYNY